MTSISFARVIATYKTRSSSAIVWRVFFSAIAMRARDGKYARFSISTTFAPIYSELSSSTLIEASLRLNCRDKSARNTTGNSSPFDWWMVMICAASSCPACAREDGSCPLSSSSSIYRKKPIRL